MCWLCWLLVAKIHNFPQIWTFGGSCADPLLPMRAKFSVLEQTHGICLLAKFCLDRFATKNPNFCIFWTSAFSGVANWQQSEKAEHGCTTTNLTLSSNIKIVSVLQHLHGEIGRTNSDIQKHDGQTKKTQTFLAAMPEKSEPHQTWHGDTGRRARSCTSKTFGVSRIVLPLGGAKNLG